MMRYLCQVFPGQSHTADSLTSKNRSIGYIFVWIIRLGLSKGGYQQESGRVALSVHTISFIWRPLATAFC